MSEAFEEARDNFAGRLRMIRAYRRMTLEEVADRASLHPDTVGDYEKGRGNPRVDTIARLGYALGVPARWLLAELSFPPMEDGDE